MKPYAIATMARIIANSTPNSLATNLKAADIIKEYIIVCITKIANAVTPAAAAAANFERNAAPDPVYIVNTTIIIIITNLNNIV